MIGIVSRSKCWSYISGKRGHGGMKILMVNKFLYPRGGAETYVFRLGELLSSRGHEVQYFGMEDERNLFGNELGLATSSMDLQAGIRSNLLAPLRIIYSREAYRKMLKLLETFQPDVLHLNNIQFYLTPSVILAAQRYREERDRQLRIVYTAHDYQLLCPRHDLLDAKMRPCECCLDGTYFHCLRGKCMKHSYLKSFLGMVDAFVWSHSRVYEAIDTILCPSNFMKEKLDTQERFRRKTRTLHNVIPASKPKQVEKENYVLYFGRLTKEKGTLTLLQAARKLPEIRFVFAGNGEVAQDIRTVPNAEYVGFRSGEELELLIRKAKFSICPSEWYENCPYSVLESQMLGTTVIGSRIGGIPELIRDGENGLLFEAGNVEQLKECIEELWYDAELLKRCSEKCKSIEWKTEDSYYEKLLAIYRE